LIPINADRPPNKEDCFAKGSGVMRSLVLYYSVTGHTQTVARLLAERLGADLVRVTCPVIEGGFMGGLRQVWYIFTNTVPQIIVPDPPGEAYDLVVMAGPVWAARPAPPLRAMIVRQPAFGKDRAIFLTCDGTSQRFSARSALATAQALSPSPPIGATLFKVADINGPNLNMMVDDFADQLTEAVAIPADNPAASARS
jgi:hypothetical protein